MTAVFVRRVTRTSQSHYPLPCRANLAGGHPFRIYVPLVLTFPQMDAVQTGVLSTPLRFLFFLFLHGCDCIIQSSQEVDFACTGFGWLRLH